MIGSPSGPVFGRITRPGCERLLREYVERDGEGKDEGPTGMRDEVTGGWSPVGGAAAADFPPGRQEWSPGWRLAAYFLGGRRGFRDNGRSCSGAGIVVGVICAGGGATGSGVISAVSAANGAAVGASPAGGCAAPPLPENTPRRLNDRRDQVGFPAAGCHLHQRRGQVGRRLAEQTPAHGFQAAGGAAPKTAALQETGGLALNARYCPPPGPPGNSGWPAYW